MVTTTQSTIPSLTLLTLLTPPSSARCWHSAPHPTLPLLATACSDKTIRIYSLSSATLLSTITGGHRRSVRTCAWKPGCPPARQKDSSAPPGETVLATGSFDATAAIWIGSAAGVHGGDDDGDGGDANQSAEGDDGEDYRFAVVLEGHDSEIKSLAWSASGRFLATCSRDKSVWVWEALDSTDAGFNAGVVGAAGAGADDEDNYETVAVLQEHQGDVKCVAWHPTDETCLASASYDEGVRVWREDGDGEWGCVAVCEGHEGTVWCVDWEADTAATSSARSGRDRQEEEDGAVDEDELPPPKSGPRLVSCSDDLSIRVWRRAPKRQRPAPGRGPRIPSVIRSSADDEEWSEEAHLPVRHERAIYSVAWSKLSGRVVSAGSDGLIR